MMKLHEITSEAGDPLMYDILQQRLGRKERIMFQAWDGSEDVSGLLQKLEKDDTVEPAAYLFHFIDQKESKNWLDTMGFLASDLENANLQKVGDEWHLTIPKPKKE